jgi:hypothetical protein
MKTMLGLISLAAPTNAAIVKDIVALTEFLLLQQQQYRPISENYLAYYCYETYETPLPSGSTLMIVPKVSAVPPTATESQRIEMATDHIRIAKYESSADETFKRLVLPLRAMDGNSRPRCDERWKKFKGESLLLLQCCYSLTSAQEF